MKVYTLKNSKTCNAGDILDTTFVVVDDFTVYIINRKGRKNETHGLRSHDARAEYKRRVDAGWKVCKRVFCDNEIDFELQYPNTCYTRN